MATIWVYAETDESGKVNATSLEILTKAREIGDTEAIVLGRRLSLRRGDP